MLDWILKLLLPATIALERSKTLSEAFSDTRQGVGSQTRNNASNRDEQPIGRNQ